MSMSSAFHSLRRPGCPVIVDKHRRAATAEEEELLALGRDHLLNLFISFTSSWLIGASSDSREDHEERYSRLQLFMTLYRTLERDLLDVGFLDFLPLDLFDWLERRSLEPFVLIDRDHHPEHPDRWDYPVLESLRAFYDIFRTKD